MCRPPDRLSRWRGDLSRPVSDSGAPSPATVAATSSDNGRESPEHFVDRRAVRKNVEDLRIDHHDVGALREAGGRDAADPTREIVLRPHRVAVDDGGVALSLALHIASARVESPAVLKRAASGVDARRMLPPRGAPELTSPGADSVLRLSNDRDRVSASPTGQ